MLGVLYALMQHDLKRLLAYHTVENIGIIFIGLGLALAFKAQRHGAGAAALALTAALFHVFNHSLFKSLLFFGAGAVLTATGERDMEHLGGLIHRMPQTAFAFLVGCVGDLGAAAAQRLRLGMADLPGDPAEPAAAALGIEVPGAGGRRAARALRRAGGRLLRQGVRHHVSRPAAHARPRDARRRPTGSRWQRCSARRALSGRGHPARLFHRCARAGGARRSSASACRVQSGVAWLSIVPIAESRSSYNGLLVFLFMLARGALAAFAIHRLASDRLRRGPAWDCGYPDPSPATQYTAVELRAADPPRVRHDGVSRARAGRDAAARRYAAGAARRVELRDLIWDALYAPDRGRHRLRRRAAQPAAVPDHPPAI